MMRVCVAICVMAFSGMASAADLAGGYRAACPTWGYSQLAARYGADVAPIMAHVRQRYEIALAVSAAPGAGGDSERYTWAYATRGACGRAIGYLSMGEINHERLWDCECYYSRMGGPAIASR